MAVLDAVDKGQLHLNDVAIVRPSDLGMSIQPLAKLVGPNGFKTAIQDLLVRMLVDSDGAATNFLVRDWAARDASRESWIKKEFGAFISIGLNRKWMQRRQAYAGLLRT